MRENKIINNFSDTAWLARKAALAVQSIHNFLLIFVNN
jgi:hypothetical protein